MTRIINKFQITIYLYLVSGIEPADDSPPLPPSIQTPAASHITSSFAVISETVTSFPVPEAKDMETTLESKLQLAAASEKTEFSAATSNATLPTTALSSNISSQPTEMTSGRSTTAISETMKSNLSLSSPIDVSPLFPSTVSSKTSMKIQLISSDSTKLLRATEPQTETATLAVATGTESETKPIAASVFTRTPPGTTEIPVKTKIMEVSETGTLPMKEAQVKPEVLTKFTASSFESITEKTTAYLPQFSTSPPLGVPSYTPPVNLTGTSEGTKISLGQRFTTVANVTVTSLSPVITALSSLKPVSSATTKAAIVLTEQRVKTTFSPVSTSPPSLGKAITEPSTEMVQHLTGTVEVPFTTTLGPKTTTLHSQQESSETTLLTSTTHKKEPPQKPSHVEHMSSSYFLPYSLHPSSTIEKSTSLSTKRPLVSVPTPASPASGELKKTFKTVSTAGYSSYTVLNTTGFLTTLYTKYPVVAETTSVTPLSVEVTSKITSPFVLAAKSTLFSGKTSSKYEPTLVSSTAQTGTSAYSGSVTTSAVKTFMSSKETTTVPFVAMERESAQKTSLTGSPLTLTAAETVLLTTQPDRSQPERTTTLSTRKPSAFPFSPSSSLISLNISLPSLPSYEKAASLTALSPVHTSHDAKEKSTPSPSVVFPVTKPLYTFSTSQYLADKSVSSPSLTQMILAVTTTQKFPVETTASMSTVRSVTDTVKLKSATGQPSFSWQPSSGDKLPVQTTKTMVIPQFSIQKGMELGRQTSEPLLISQSVTPIFQYPAETLTKSTGQPQRDISTTEATVELASSYPSITSLPEGIHSSILPSSVGPTQVILPKEKELHLTDSVTQPYLSRTSVLQSAVPGTPTADLIFGTRILPSSPEVLATSSSLATIKTEAFPSFSTQKAGTGLKPTWQASFTELLDSHQTLETTTASPESTSSPVSLPETAEIPIVMGSGPSPSMSHLHQRGTEKTMVLPKQVMLSTTTYSPMFVASTRLSAMDRVSAAASASSVISSTGIVSATSDKAKAVTESITSSLGSPYFSITLEAKGAMPLSTAKSEEAELMEAQAVHTPDATVISKTPQMFYSPYPTNTTVIPSNVSVSSTLSMIHSSTKPQPFSSTAASSASTTQSSKLELSPEVPSVSSLLVISDYPNDTAPPSVSSFAYLSTKPLYGLTTTLSDGLVTAEDVSGETASAFMLPRETATLQTCTVSN